MTRSNFPTVGNVTCILWHWFALCVSMNPSTSEAKLYFVLILAHECMFQFYQRLKFKSVNRIPSLVWPCLQIFSGVPNCEICGRYIHLHHVCLIAVIEFFKIKSFAGYFRVPNFLPNFLSPAWYMCRSKGPEAIKLWPQRLLLCL